MPSSVIATYRYHNESGSLYITYVSGAVYIYKNVPLKIYEAMKKAISKGTFLNTKIKGHFAYEKLN